MRRDFDGPWATTSLSICLFFSFPKLFSIITLRMEQEGTEVLACDTCTLIVFDTCILIVLDISTITSTQNWQPADCLFWLAGRVIGMPNTLLALDIRMPDVLPNSHCASRYGGYEPAVVMLRQQQCWRRSDQRTRKWSTSTFSRLPSTQQL